MASSNTTRALIALVTGVGGHFLNGNRRKGYRFFLILLIWPVIFTVCHMALLLAGLARAENPATPLGAAAVFAAGFIAIWATSVVQTIRDPHSSDHPVRPAGLYRVTELTLVSLATLALYFYLLLAFVPAVQTSLRCADTPGFPKSFNEMTSELAERLLPGVEPGMTREQVRIIFQELRKDPEIAASVALDDSDPEFLYFLAGTCPHLRYRFENNRLVAAGRLGMEAGSWTYVGRVFTETRCNIGSTNTGEAHWFRTIPKYDQQGHFIGIEKMDDGPLAKGIPRLCPGGKDGR